MEDRLSSPELHVQTEPSLTGIRFTRRRMLWIGFLAAATIAALLTLGDAPSTFSAIQQADWRLMALAVLVHYSGFAVRGHRWQLLLRASGHRLGYLHVTSVLLGGWFVSALLPARLGDVFRIAVLRLPSRPSRHAVPVADSLGSIILERALDISALLLLSATFGYLALGNRVPGWVATIYVAALTILILLVVVVLLAPGLLHWFEKLSANRWWVAAFRFAQQTAASLRTLPAHPRIGLAAAAESLYIWLCDALLLWLVLAAIGIQMSFGNAGFVALTVDISAAVPLTPGGMGQIEAAYSVLLALLAVAPAGISAAVLLVRIISYWSFLIFSGIVAFAAGLGGVLLQREPSAASPAANTQVKSS